MYRTRIGLLVASAVLVVVSLFISGTNVVEGVIAVGDSASARQQTVFYDERYDIARRRMPETPAEPQDIKAAVEMAEQLRAFKTTPRAMVVTLSEGLADFPGLQLESIDWLTSTDQDKPIGGRNQRADVRSRSSSTGGDSNGTRLYQMAHIKGRVDPFDGDYRQALVMVRRFANTLQGLPEVEVVHLLELPLDTGSDTALSGDTERQASTAPFELRMVIRDKADESS
jgi:hypothetical protein